MLLRLELIPGSACARVLLVAYAILATAGRAHAAEDCVTIHGRAHLYCGDGQLRIWHIGTHHEFEPDETSWERVVAWLEAGVKESDKKQSACPAGDVYLFADFEVCPTEPLKQGAVQRAVIKSASHRRYVPVK